jgi:hypothetical protein
MTYYVVLMCTWNLYVVQNFGWYKSNLEGLTFSDESTVDLIKSTLHDQLRVALTDMTGADLYSPVDHIKMVVKQQKGFKAYTNSQAGSLTNAAAAALQQICDENAGPNSQLSTRNDKLYGRVYVQTNVATGQKYQVINN